MDALTDWFDYVSTNFDRILEATLDHARIVLIVLALATVFAVLLGVVVQRNAVARTIALSIAGISLTIPSLAFFAVLIPFVGTGNTPAMIALFFYAQLPILRNTVTGLDSVSPAVVESAKGMGMNTLQQLFRVRLPLAWPVILAGVRVASLLTVSIASIAVLVGGDGLGVYIQNGINRSGLPNASNQIYVGVIFSVLLGLILDSVLALFQRLTTARGLRI